MGSFAIPSLSALGLWRRGSKNTRRRTGRRPGAGSIPWPEPRLLPWPGSGQGTHGSDWWRAQFGPPARIREWAVQKLTTGRLFPWFAVAYGAGVILYFTAEREPAEAIQLIKDKAIPSNAYRRKTDFAKLLAKSKKNVRSVGWRHIKNMLSAWGLWPIESIPTS
jgi:hypothetical protein